MDVVASPTASSLLVASFVLGLGHAFDPDHIAAVSVLASERPSWRSTLRCASHWALGHAAAIVTLGLVGVWAWPGRSLEIAHAERVIGCVLILLGGWMALVARTAPRPERGHRHAAHLMGLLHGTAGLGPAMALLPLAAGASIAWSAATLLAFSLGVFAAMSGTTALAGSMYERLASSRSAWTAVGRLSSGLFAMSIGVRMVWLGTA